MMFLLAMLGGLLGGLSKSLITSLVAGEVKAKLMAWLEARLRLEARELPPGIAEDQTTEWLAELDTLKDRPWSAIRFVLGLRGAGQAIADAPPESIASRGRRLLLWIAGGDPRDLVVRSDQNRYLAIGFVLVFQFVYACLAMFLGLRIAIGESSVWVTLVELVASALFGAAVVAIDRSVPKAVSADGTGGLSRRSSRRSWIALRSSLAIVLAVSTASLTSQTIYRPQIDAVVTSQVMGGSSATTETSQSRAVGALRNAGVLERQQALNRILIRDASALTTFAMLFLLLLSIDLLAVVLKLTGRHSEYARRQRERALRAQLELADRIWRQRH